MTNKNNILTCAMIALFTLTAISANAVKKNDPDKDDVEDILKELGGVHWQEDMDINAVGSVEVEDEESGEETYFHVFSGVAEEQYRIIIFDNKPQYLGYYNSNYEPVEHEKGAVLLDAGDGESYFYISLTTDGPADKIRIDLTPTTFIKNEQADVGEGEGSKSGTKGDAAASSASEKDALEYREWTLKARGEEYTFEAIFVRREGDRIFLKESKRGLTNDFPLEAFSLEDLKYLKEVAE